MTVYFMRHGETEWNINGIINGLTDVCLTENSKNSAEQLKGHFETNKISFDYVISSPLKRAKETACIVSGKKNDEIVIYNELIERDFRELEGELVSKYTIKDIEKKAESHMSIYKRVIKALRDISKLKAESILVVSHESVLRHIYTYIVNSDYKVLDIGNLGYYTAEFVNNKWKIKDNDNLIKN